ncbi:MAG: PAS domain S-box protein [Chitinophagales bacterium]
MAGQPFSDYISISDSSGLSAAIHFRNIVEWINEGIFCVNSEGRILYANDQFCRNLGYTASEIHNTFIFSYFWDEEQTRISKTKLELRKKGLSDSYDIKMKKKNGDPVWIRVNGKPVFDAQGHFVASIAIHIDVTRQKALEEELIYAKEDLEEKVLTRTRQLTEANFKLNEEIRAKKLAEVSLINSDKRFKDIFLNSPDAIYVESADGVILDVNEATCQLHGISREELVGKTIYDISPVESHAIIKERQPKIMSGEIRKFETECIARDGVVTPIEVSAALIVFKDKPALLIHVRDISDRRQNQLLMEKLNHELEEKVKERTRELEAANEQLQREAKEKEKIYGELQKQKDFLRMIIDASPSLIFVKDKDGKFLLANESAAKFYNMTTQEMEGHFDTEHNFNKEELDYFMWQDEEVLKGGKEVHFPEKQYVNPVNGKITWLSTIKKPIESLTGEQVNVLGVATDVTAIKQTKEELRKSEQLYREIARHLPKAAMFIFDRDLRFIVAEGPLVGVISKPKSEIEGKTIYEAIRESEVERVEKIYREILAGDNSDFERIHFDKHIRIHHIPIRDDEGNIIYGMVLVFDITDLKAVQKELEKRAGELERSNEELERFAYVASHDLQGPLRTIASYMQLLEMRYKDKLDTEASEFITFSVNGAKRMQSLIQDLLSYSRLSSAPKPLATVNIRNVIEVVSNNLDATIQNSNANLIIDEMPVITGESSQLVQLYQNLLDNALKFIPQGTRPEIRLTAKELEDEWEFGISDNGIGIRNDFKERIFHIFQRLHTDNEYPGTGVGLAICKKITQLHGGRIWFESEPGQGTTFYFTISKHLKPGVPQA